MLPILHAVRFQLLGFQETLWAGMPLASTGYHVPFPKTQTLFKSLRG